MAAEDQTSKDHLVRFFGDQDLSDVILQFKDSEQIKGVEYHVHRMFLAARSPYFKKLFANHPTEATETKMKITLDENADKVRLVLALIYETEHLVDDDCKFVPMSKFEQSSQEDRDLFRVLHGWNYYNEVVRLAKKYEVEEIVFPTMDRRLVFGKCGSPQCLECAVRKFIGLQHNLKHVIKQITVDAEALGAAVLFLSRELQLSEFEIESEAFRHLFHHLKNGNEETSEDELENDEAREFTYGDPHMNTDVTLTAGDFKFHVHKMFLAARSQYFSSLFFGDFLEKDLDEIEVGVDEHCVRRVLDLLYHGHINDSREFLSCSRDPVNVSKNVQRFWDRLPNIVELFKYFQLPLHLIEDALCASWCGSVSCTECANKRLFAMHYKLNKVKSKIPADPPVLAGCFLNSSCYLVEPFRLSPQDLCEVFGSRRINPIVDPSYQPCLIGVNPFMFF